MKRTFDPPEQAAQLATTAAPASVLPEASASTVAGGGVVPPPAYAEDRKSTRLNSSHLVISYAVFCLKKKKSIYKELLPLNPVFFVIIRRSLLLAVNHTLPSESAHADRPYQQLQIISYREPGENTSRS